MKKLALIAMIPLLIACGPPPVSLSRLNGTTWHFTAIDGQAPIGKEASLTFSSGRIGANVGCNGMGADARIAGGRIVAGPVMSTQMYCEGVMEQERAVSALLAAKPKVFVRGTLLRLTGGGHSAELHLEE